MDINLLIIYCFQSRTRREVIKKHTGIKQHRQGDMSSDEEEEELCAALVCRRPTGIVSRNSMMNCLNFVECDLYLLIFIGN